MIESEVIIIGGGPAGSACAWQLHRHQIPALIIDKSTFPRLKLCAGWVQPRIWRQLQLGPEDYPHGLLLFKKLHFHFYGHHLPVPTRQYSIRRTEFDRWLLERSAVEVHRHRVQHIRFEDGFYVIDDRYRSRYLVGAGGTNCPVYRTFFRNSQPREEELRISTIEEEFPYDYRDKRCLLWFFEDGLPGYAWYVPKANGYLNVGIGGQYIKLRAQQKTIRSYWQPFVEKLRKLNLVNDHPFHHKGYNYYLRRKQPVVQNGRAYIVGDALGLATIDMGEGIGPAVESGILAAKAIIQNQAYTIGTIPKYSFPRILFPRLLR